MTSIRRDLVGASLREADAIRRSNMSFHRFVVVGFFASMGMACSSSETSSGTDAGGVTDAGSDTASSETSGSDTASSDAAETAPSDTCIIKRAATTKDCAELCDARLFLPGGDAYCTITCAKDSECTPLGADLKCSTETGTCMPKCTDNASCTSAGFKRCDADAGACDTI